MSSLKSGSDKIITVLISILRGIYGRSKNGDTE